MLGQVEGRTVADVLAWLSTTPLTWRKRIRHVAIDMSPPTVPRSAPACPTPPSWSTTSTSSNSPTRCSPWSVATPPPRCADAADAPATRSGRRGGVCCETARASPTSSSPPCGTRCRPKGRSAAPC
ncbi:hypothetical protein KGS77_17645 [Streptomyces sp. MST-110588]|nr:hypothetical protein KGS77_17645 [Streptomyces sp. MST-110588]